MKAKLDAAWAAIKTFGVGIFKVIVIGFCAVRLFQKIQEYIKWLDEK